MNSLQKEEHGSKHWDSRYRGSHGAVAEARQTYQDACRKMTEHFSSELPRYRSQTKVALVAYVSTLLSALSPTLKKLRFSDFFMYMRELRKALYILEDYGYDGLSSVEMEVAIAGLLRAWIIPSPNWAQNAAKHLASQVLRDPGTTFSSRLLVKARMASHGILPEEDRVAYLRFVSKAVEYACKNGLHSDLNWSTVARLASMMGKKRCMRFAAMQDGSPDVLIKYGPFTKKIGALLSRWNT
jgi:hypothetical protein